VWATLGSLVVTVLLAWTLRANRASTVDLAVDRLSAVAPGWLTSFVSPAIEIFGPVHAVGASLGLSLICIAWREFRGAFVSAVAPAVALVVTELALKPLVSRPPVLGEGHAFPSGHATAVFGLWIAAVLVLRENGPLAHHVPSAVRWSGMASAALAAMYLCLALIIYRHHFVTDIVGALAVAIAVSLLIAMATDVASDRLTAHRSLRRRSTP
jgi:membrane-associated phospholipid phosphatase